jgi:hypothetical protein
MKLKFLWDIKEVATAVWHWAISHTYIHYIHTYILHFTNIYLVTFYPSLLTRFLAAFFLSKQGKGSGKERQ